jgi:hypothetical protein
MRYEIDGYEVFGGWQDRLFKIDPEGLIRYELPDPGAPDPWVEVIESFWRPLTDERKAA